MNKATQSGAAVWAIPAKNAVVEVRKSGARFVVVAVSGGKEHRIGARGFGTLAAAQERASYVAREFDFESSSNSGENRG